MNIVREEIVQMTINTDLIDHLMDPSSNHDALDIGSKDGEQLQAYLQQMLLIRAVENKLALGRKDRLIGGPVHLGVGQEAIAVGVSTHLRKTDRIFGAHRSHAHALSLGADVRKLLAEVLGRDTGLSKGMGGSMHLWDQPNGFYGSVPIVSGTVPLAVGAAMAARLQKTDDVAVAYFGDGACEEGVVHESLNLASIQKDPILFVVENNMFASHMHWSQRQPKASTSRFAVANDIPYRIVDGNDVLAVETAAKELIEISRAGKGPGFLEAFTYRWYGHVDWREDIDVGVSRSQEDVDNWRAKDPIARLASSMVSRGLLSAQEIDDLIEQIESDVNQAWGTAMNDPYPELGELQSRVYK